MSNKVMVLYAAEVFFLGADHVSTFYFDTKEKAYDFIWREADGKGDYYKVLTIWPEPINYRDGCTHNDLVMGAQDSCIIELTKGWRARARRRLKEDLGMSKEEANALFEDLGLIGKKEI